MAAGVLGLVAVPGEPVGDHCSVVPVVDGRVDFRRDDFSSWAFLRDWPPLTAHVSPAELRSGDRFPGQFVGPFGFYEHGWPWTWRRRVELAKMYPSDEWDLHRERLHACPWMQSLGWHFRGGASAVDANGAALDLAVAAAALAALAAAFEWRRRRRSRLVQFTLAELLLATLAVAAALGWWASHRQRLQREQALLDTLGKSVVRSDETDYAGPRWLARLAGRENLPSFHAVRLVEIGPDCRGERLHECLADLASLANLRELRFDGTQLDRRSLDALGRFDRLEWLEFSFARLRVDGSPAESGDPAAQPASPGSRPLESEDIEALCRALPDCWVLLLGP